MNDFKIIISKKTGETLNRYKQIGLNTPEACGVLIGEHSINSKRITVSKATIPNKKDKRERYFFKMSSNAHQKMVNKEFSNSGGESVYLGTWHSHPEPIPNPSNVDKKDWLKQFKINSHIFDTMIFIIVGIKETRIWYINDSEIKLIPKQQVIYE